MHESSVSETAKKKTNAQETPGFGGGSGGGSPGVDTGSSDDAGSLGRMIAEA